MKRRSFLKSIAALLVVKQIPDKLVLDESILKVSGSPYPPGFAEGGIVTGIRGSDRIPMLLEPGELMNPARTASELIDKMNERKPTTTG